MPVPISTAVPSTRPFLSCVLVTVLVIPSPIVIVRTWVVRRGGLFPLITPAPTSAIPSTLIITVVITAGHGHQFMETRLNLSFLLVLCGVRVRVGLEVVDRFLVISLVTRLAIGSAIRLVAQLSLSVLGLEQNQGLSWPCNNCHSNYTCQS